MTSSLWTQKITLPSPVLADSLCRIVHLAGAIDPEKLADGRGLLQEAGVHITWDPGANTPSSYLAASDTQRLRDWTRSFGDPRVRALLCARGGYGTMRLLDKLPPVHTPERMPWLVGYSDITALHLWLNAQGIASIHGPMVAGLPRHERASGDELNQLISLLRTCTPFAFTGLRTVHGGQSNGRLIGGNLSLLQAMMGTRWLPHLDGAILLIEEIDEAAYAVDRMLQSLALGGRANGLRGIVFGDFHGCKGLDARQLPDWLAHWTEIFECPVVQNMPVGHGTQNAPVMLGVDYALDADAGTLTPLPLRAEQTRKSTKDGNKTRENTGDTGRSDTQRLEQTRAARLNKNKATQAATIHITPDETPMGAGSMPRPSVSPGRVTNLLTEMLDLGACSALQLVCSIDGEVTHNLSMGSTAVTASSAIAPVTPNTRFDLASVSKAISTAILCHQFIDRGVWSVNDRVPESISTCGATLAELLSHRSGLPAWKRLYDEARRQPAANQWLRNAFHALERNAEANTQCVYSDPGYILLGWWLEHIADESLDALFQKHIATPLGLTHSEYRRSPPDVLSRAQYAATEYCPWRGRVLQGIVHDEHAQILGGVSGHAGVFSTAGEVDCIARALLQSDSPLLSKAGVERMWSKSKTLCEGAYTFGWDTPTVTPSNAGSLMDDAHTVGHLGYAGTSLWIDRSRKISITFLTNRVHPSRDSQAIRRFRPAIHDAVMRDLGLSDLD